MCGTSTQKMFCTVAQDEALNEALQSGSLPVNWPNYCTFYRLVGNLKSPSLQ